METLILEVPRETVRWLDEVARRTQRSRSAVVRDALERYRVGEARPSALQAAGAVVGSVASGRPDLGSNKAHLRGFGR